MRGKAILRQPYHEVYFMDLPSPKDAMTGTGEIA
jgi:hypothetical protein